MSLFMPCSHSLSCWTQIGVTGTTSVVVDAPTVNIGPSLATSVSIGHGATNSLNILGQVLTVTSGTSASLTAPSVTVSATTSHSLSTSVLAQSASTSASYTGGTYSFTVPALNLYGYPRTFSHHFQLLIPMVIAGTVVNLGLPGTSSSVVGRAQAFDGQFTSSWNSAAPTMTIGSASTSLLSLSSNSLLSMQAPSLTISAPTGVTVCAFVGSFIVSLIRLLFRVLLVLCLGQPLVMSCFRVLEPCKCLPLAVPMRRVCCASTVLERT